MPEREILTDTSDMHIPHGMFRNALEAAPRVVEVAGDDAERAADVVTFYRDVLAFLAAHHGAEDALLWPLLRTRRPEEAALFERMESQHAGVHELSDAAARAVGTYAAAPTPENGHALVTAIRGLATELSLHFGEEEREILPLAATTVTPEEWGAMPGWAMAHFDGANLWLVLGLIFEQVGEEGAQAILGHVPPPVREMWTSMGAARFASFTASLRGTTEAAASL